MSNPPDVVGSYAEMIRSHLAAKSQPLTVSEICENLTLSDRLVRMGLDRLVFAEKTVEVKFRHTPHRRGAMPLEYRLLPAA